MSPYDQRSRITSDEARANVRLSRYFSPLAEIIIGDLRACIRHESAHSGCVVERGGPYFQGLNDDEMDRVVELFREDGFYVDYDKKSFKVSWS